MIIANQYQTVLDSTTKTTRTWKIPMNNPILTSELT
jgi:hypothetical protein